MASFELAKAYVTLSTKGQSDFTRTLEQASAGIRKFAKERKEAQGAPTPGARPTPAPHLIAPQVIGEEIARRNQAAKNRAESVEPFSKYAQSRGLNLAGKDAEVLVKKMSQLKDIKAFDKWIDGQVQLQQGFEKTGKALTDWMSMATTHFAAGTASLYGFVQAASPAHWDTFTGSIGLVNQAIGQAFLPYVEKAIQFLQDLYYTIKEMDPETKETIANFLMLGGAILAIAPAVATLRFFLSPLIATYALLNSSLLLLGTGLKTSAMNMALLSTSTGAASTGFTALGTRITAATTAMRGFIAANPVLAIMAVVGALALASSGFGRIGDSVEKIADQMTRLEALGERLRTGGAFGVRELRQALSPDQIRLLQEAHQQGPEAFQRAVSGLQQNAQIQANDPHARQLQHDLNEILHQSNIQDVGYFSGGTRTSAQLRQIRVRRALLERGYSDREATRISQTLNESGGLGSGGLFSTNLHLSENTIQQAIQSIGRAAQMGQTAGDALERLRTMPHEEARALLAGERNAILHNINFAQYGAGQFSSIEQAWKRLQSASAALSPLQREQLTNQMQQLERLQHISETLDSLNGTAEEYVGENGGGGFEGPPEPNEEYSGPVTFAD